MTLVANAGVLLEYEGTALLLDGVFGPEGHPFSAPSEESREALLAGRAPFERLDYLLFTHLHPDHLSLPMTEELLRRRAVRGVFLPDTGAVRESGLTDLLRERGVPGALLSDRTDRARYQIEPGICVRAFRTRHLDKKFEHVEHFCYVLTFGEKRLAFTADVDYVNEDLRSLGGERLRAVFVNPLFFSALRTGKFFRGELNTESIVVYHVPFDGDDATGHRARLQRDLARWDRERPDALALTEPFQRLIL